MCLSQRTAQKPIQGSCLTISDTKYYIERTIAEGYICNKKTHNAKSYSNNIPTNQAFHLVYEDIPIYNPPSHQSRSPLHASHFLPATENASLSTLSTRRSCRIHKTRIPSNRSSPITLASFRTLQGLSFPP